MPLGAATTAEEMKAAGSGLQRAPLGIGRVDISPKHGEGVLKKGEVIKAWEVAVATPKVGEAFRLTCKPEYAHDWASSPPQTPSNATLVFEVPENYFCVPDLGQVLENDGPCQLPDLPGITDILSEGHRPRWGLTSHLSNKLVLRRRGVSGKGPGTGASEGQGGDFTGMSDSIPPLPPPQQPPGEGDEGDWES